MLLHNIRALTWSSEVPFIVISGSWAGELRVWDIRNASCLQVLHGHHADVYAVVSHPNRPFTFASCSRDTSVRLWNATDSFAGKIALELALDEGLVRTSSMGELKSAMHPYNMKVTLCGRRSQHLARQSEEIKDNALQRQFLWSDFFHASKTGVKQLFEQRPLRRRGPDATYQ